MRYSQSGFSLLEVLVAFVILSFSLGLIFQIVGRGATAFRLGVTYNQAIVLAESQLALASADGADLASSGRIADRFDWTLQTSSSAPTFTSEMPSMLPLMQRTIRVVWIEQGKPRAVEIFTLHPANTP